MRKLLKRIDNFIDRAWRNTCATIFYYFDKRVEEDDIDWLNMHNFIQSEKNVEFNEKEYWENRTKVYLEETKHIDKWKND